MERKLSLQVSVWLHKCAKCFGFLLTSLAFPYAPYQSQANRYQQIGTHFWVSSRHPSLGSPLHSPCDSFAKICGNRRFSSTSSQQYTETEWHPGHLLAFFFFHPCIIFSTLATLSFIPVHFFLGDLSPPKCQAWFPSCPWDILAWGNRKYPKLTRPETAAITSHSQKQASPRVPASVEVLTIIPVQKP